MQGNNNLHVKFIGGGVEDWPKEKVLQEFKGEIHQSIINHEFITGVTIFDEYGDTKVIITK